MSGLIRVTIPVILVALGIFGAGRAEAYDNGYCRDYTRTVYIGNSVQEAQGRACLQDNGDWVIVGEGLSGNFPDTVNNVEYVIHDRPRDIIPPQVVYYDAYPSYARTVTPVFIWQKNGYYRGRDYYSFSRPVYYDNHRHYYKKNWYGRDDRPRYRDRDRDWHNPNSYGRVERRGDGRWDGNRGRGGYDPRGAGVATWRNRD